MESNNNLYSYKNGIVRTVNQIEMERLQGFPDGYTSILSKAKAGSLLGDGWTLPIIEHIFSFIKNKR
jgi:DNA (cytosine-5)-methyltransferase 3A